MVVRGGLRDYRDEHPSVAALVVEVAMSSLIFDRRHKGSVYARAGVADYWIVNLVDRVLEVHRVPVADAAADFGWRYADVTTLTSEAIVAPLAGPVQSVAVADRLP
jgi:Uma2 family endonuclease